MDLLKIQDSTFSKRSIDDNGFLIVENNPIARAGVFDYLLSEISPNVSKEADRVVKVYRPFDSLVLVKDEFANKPIMENHKFLGNYGEANQADGAIGSVITSDDKEFLKADLIIYNPLVIEKIQKNELVELSPAYIGEIEKKQGRFNGVDYEYIQTIKSVNHLAIVENGRSGYELRIQDSNFKKGVDKMALKLQDFLKSLRVFADELQEAETKDDELDRREVVREIMAISAKPDTEFEGGETEKVETIAKLAEKLAYQKDNEVGVKDNETNVSDSESETKDSECEVKDSEVNAEFAKELLEAISGLIDKKIAHAFKAESEAEAKEAQLIQDSYNEVSKVLGMNFDKSGKSASDIYKFGYECLTRDSLPNDIDSKSAFMVVSKNRKTQTQQVLTQDSNVESDVLKALEKMGGVK